MSGIPLYDSLNSNDFSEEKCFLCGQELHDKRSKEHIFPRWLLRKFNLYNSRVTLLNNTSIPYRQLTVPCCFKCNNERLSIIEKDTQEIMFGDKNFTKDLKYKPMFMLWAGKILFTLLYRQVFLPFSRSNMDKRSIVSREFIDKYRLLHFYLQAFRFPMGFYTPNSDFIASVHCYRLQSPKTISAQFDYRDNPYLGCIWLRLGTVGVIVALDGGLQTACVGDILDKYKNYELHPLQFEELGAKFFYKCTLLKENPELTIKYYGESYMISYDPVSGHANEPQIYDQWVNKTYARVLSVFTALPEEILVTPNGSSFMTWLTPHDSEDYLPMSIEEFPWRDVP